MCGIKQDLLTVIAHMIISNQIQARSVACDRSTASCVQFFQPQDCYIKQRSLWQDLLPTRKSIVLSGLVELSSAPRLHPEVLLQSQLEGCSCKLERLFAPSTWLERAQLLLQNKIARELGENLQNLIKSSLAWLLP